MIVKLKQTGIGKIPNGSEVEVDQFVGNLLIDRGVAEAVPVTNVEPEAAPTHYKKPFALLDPKAQATRPELYALRDEISKHGVPVKSADAITLAIHNLTLRVSQLEADCESRYKATLGAATSPHLAKIEKR